MNDSWHRGDWMQTFTGRQFYPLSPRAQDIDPKDIAHSLAMQCRYNGHVDRFYSVAEHCLLISAWLESQGASPLVQLEGLLHDATEAYVGDMIRPLKLSMPAYREAEAGVQMEVWKRFDLPSISYSDGTVAFAQETPLVKEADTRILLDEREALMAGKAPAKWGQDDLEPLGVHVEGLAPVVAKHRYLQRLDDLGVVW